MHSEVEIRMIEILKSAFYEINQIIGYEYFDKATIENRSVLFSMGLSFAEQLLRDKRGVDLKDLKIGDLDEERTKRASLIGIFHGLILRGYKGSSFEEKYEDFLYRSGIENCSWIKKTDYDIYYRTLNYFVSKIKSDRDVLIFINEFTKRKIYSTTQHLTKIIRSQKFYHQIKSIDERTIDEYIDIFRELGAIAENYLKLLYGIQHNHRSKEDIVILEQKSFGDIWKSIRKDPNLKAFTDKPFPNTVYWNASKHLGSSKKVDSKEVEFKSNEGYKRLSYSDFISLVREVYSVAVVLGKINLMVNFQNKVYF